MRRSTSKIAIGIDIGSMTVKAVVVDPETKSILWSGYQRHETRQAEKLLGLLSGIETHFSHLTPSSIRTFITGSGAEPFVNVLGSKFLQEVNAITMAVDRLHPDVGSVIELGGQDAKIIVYQENERTGLKHSIPSMNDKCASGTGAIIDKCALRLGLQTTDLGRFRWDPSRLHSVSAKCGVFAETDLINLLKAGVPIEEIVCSLVDGIVLQNLSVLARGHTLKPRVLLLGGPHTYLPVLQDCWRQRLPELWEMRGYEYPKEVALDQLISVPPHSQFYAALGAVFYGLHDAVEVGRYQGLADLKALIAQAKTTRLGQTVGPPLIRDQEHWESFVESYRLPNYEPAQFKAGQVVRGVLGLDGGSASSKAVLIDPSGRLLCKQYRLSQGNPIADAKELLSKIKSYIEGHGATLSVIGFGTTGYAADVLGASFHADVNIVETVAHLMSAKKYFDPIHVICDIGGQDIKVLFLVNGEIRSFRLSNQCSAGNGMLLQAMAHQFGIPLSDYAQEALRAKRSPNFSYGCAVFLDSDRVHLQKEGFSREELLAGLALVLPKNIWQYVVQIPRIARLGTHFLLQGGTQYNLAAVKAQVDYIKQRVPEAKVFVHPHPGEAGAIGAALEALRITQRRGWSTFIGLDQAIDIQYTAKNDDSTRCAFCANHCSRTFVDTFTPDGRSRRYISGFHCEKGTVESKEDLLTLTKERKDLKATYPNLVDMESKLAFQSEIPPKSIPEAGTPIEKTIVKPSLFGNPKRVRRLCHFERSDARYRKRLSIGIPRILNIYSTAPLWRTYFATLGVPPHQIIFSPFTSEELWSEGGKYGSIDPCFPAKVAQAHIHHLLFHSRRKLDYLFCPCLTHLPTFVADTINSWGCPVAAGTPKVLRAAFSKEGDYFKKQQVEYLDPALTLAEPNYFQKQMVEVFGARLSITDDENSFACEQGFESLRRFEAQLQERGRHVLQTLERSHEVGILLLSRPYHSDPGMNHGILEMLQASGYPILSIRSIPKDRQWLERFFESDLRQGRIEDPLSISDVWPENYSANSAEKVWGAKFAARHPNLAVLDLSSFKCGNDAPVYALIDHIISSSDTPYLAMHDMDANKSLGSIQIRIKTFAHTLSLYEEKCRMPPN